MQGMDRKTFVNRDTPIMYIHNLWLFVQSAVGRNLATKCPKTDESAATTLGSGPPGVAAIFLK